MIDLNKCGGCKPVAGLAELGLDQDQVNLIASAGSYDTAASCAGEPEVMPGGWMSCRASSRVQGAMFGARKALLELGLASDLDKTLPEGEQHGAHYNPAL